jgi:hypothetical protein
MHRRAGSWTHNCLQLCAPNIESSVQRYGRATLRNPQFVRSVAMGPAQGDQQAVIATQYYGMQSESDVWPHTKLTVNRTHCQQRDSCPASGELEKMLKRP